MPPGSAASDIHYSFINFWKFLSLDIIYLVTHVHCTDCAVIVRQHLKILFNTELEQFRKHTLLSAKAFVTMMIQILCVPLFFWLFKSNYRQNDRATCSVFLPLLTGHQMWNYQSNRANDSHYLSCAYVNVACPIYVDDLL